MTFANDYTDFGIQEVNSQHKNSSDEVYVICPSCTPFRKPEHRKEKKLAVNVEKGTWFCQHCGFTGGLTPMEWVKDKPQLNMNQLGPLTPKQVEYFAGRKISEQTLVSREVKYSRQLVKQKKSGEFKEKDCISFVFREKGWMMMIKYRDGMKNFKIEKGSKLIPWGIDWLSTSDEYSIITEGEIDTLSFHEAGFTACCSVPNGTVISKEEEQHFIKTGKIMPENHLSLSYLDNTYQYFEKKPVIYIATDCDPAGIKLRHELGRRLGFEKCKIIRFDTYTYQDGEKTKTCKDANDVLQYHGPEALKYLIEKAESFPIDDIVTIDDAWDKIMEQYTHGLRKGSLTGIDSIDPHFTWRFGHLVVVNGYGNMGKSTIMLNLYILASIMYGWKWGLYLPENYPVEDAYILLIEIYLGNTLDKTKANRIGPDDLESAKKFVKSHFELVNNEGGYTPEELRSVAKRMIMQRGIIGFVIDPWNSLIHKIPTTLDNYLENELSAEQRFAVNNQIIKVIVVHPPTPQPNEKKNPTAPSVYEITGGGIWSKKAYEILCIHQMNRNDAGTKETDIVTEFHVQKVKNWKLVGFPTKGQPVLLRYHLRSNRFLSYEKVDPFTKALNKNHNEVRLSEEEDPTIF